MQKTLIIDAGHGGISPTTGKYVTPGKRAEHEGMMFHEGKWFYEGVGNREAANALAFVAMQHNVNVVRCYHDYDDMPILERVKTCIELSRKMKLGSKCYFVSLHSDAYEDPTNRGCKLFTTKKYNSSDLFATKVCQKLIGLETDFKGFNVKEDFGEPNKNEKDPDYEADYNILIGVEQYMPSLLIERAAHTNIFDCVLMRDLNFNIAFAKAIVGAVLEMN